MNQTKIPKQRSIIDRRELDGRIAEIVADGGTGGVENSRPAIIALLRDALDRGREEVARRLAAKPSSGHEACGAQSFLIDQIVRVLFDHVTMRLHPLDTPSDDQRIAILAVGGYGRAEMAPHSDVDIAFVTPAAGNRWCETVIEAMLYFLWDLGLKVGQSSRTPDEMVRMAKQDLTIRTSLLESRHVWGDEVLYDTVCRRFNAEVVAGAEQQFVTQKLEERSVRHKRMGDSRYVVEPNVKDGKGGLRDLQTLYWMGKFIHRVRSASELVDIGLFTRAEYRSFRRAEGFMLAVRCHLHIITDRAEDRLTFDLQREVAARMNFADRPGKSSVERFMQFYFLQAKRVGSLTAVFLDHIDEKFAKKRRRTGFFAGFTARARTHKGYRIHGGKIGAPHDDWFRKDPVRLIEIFQIAEAEDLDIHPDTMRQADRDSGLIGNTMRKDRRANALFLDVLTGRNAPEKYLRSMNEANVFGRFVPDFGKVNAQMQFDMYHHYTVDEHTIRAIGLLAQIEQGRLTQDHPRSAKLIHRVHSRRALYVAVLLHDIAKGRGGDHSVLGAEVAHRLCPRFGLDEAETALVAWLVEQHLLMSATAFKRDLTDPKTIEDFVVQVRSLERLRNLAILTSVDIRAVGPGTWNSWKGQLLGELYDNAQERLRLGHARLGREARVAAKKERVAETLRHHDHGDRAHLVADYDAILPDSYWIAEAEDVVVRNLVQYSVARSRDEELSIHCEYDDDRGATLVSVIAADHPGLFYRIAGGIHLAGANIIDARIHTARSGWAIDNFLIQDPHGDPFREERQLTRIKQAIGDALANRVELAPRLARRPLPISRSKAFPVRPRVLFENDASNRFTVVEIHARDRPALLNRVARTLFEHGLIVHSAHITAYGERAADIFYVTDPIGEKVVNADRLATIEEELLDAASDRRQAELERA
ncbi:MAG: [protein-PII] uridylyltransferase [Pontixanthobacter sp.]